MKLQPNKLQKREIMYYCPFFLLISYPINIWHMQQLQHIPTDTHQIVCCVNGQCVHTLRRCINNIHICVTYSQCSCVAQIAQIVMFSKCMWKTHCTNINTRNYVAKLGTIYYALKLVHEWNRMSWGLFQPHRCRAFGVCVCVSLSFSICKNDSVRFDWIRCRAFTDSPSASTFKSSSTMKSKHTGTLTPPCGTRLHTAHHQNTNSILK